jgi:pyruvate dehydrogenase E2 component (dihydrolipoamide acetyltransferase)
VEVRLPKFGVNMEEAFVVRWLKEEGERIEKGEALAEIETDKISTELESPVSGTLVTKVAEIDEAIQVGATVAIVEEQ